MPAPRRWLDVLRGPAYVINLESRPDRLAASARELAGAGFGDVRRFAAVDARDGEALARAWKACGAPAFASWDTKFRELPGKQGCFLSHVALWQEIVERDIPYACIFEDDVIFHRHWAALAETAFAFTPRDYDLVFMGNQSEVAGVGLVQRVPVHCLHAYLITREGARRMRETVMTDSGGVATIDSMIVAHQWADRAGEQLCPFSWYVWNGTTFPDARAAASPEYEKRNTGLVFQDHALPSDIETGL